MSHIDVYDDTFNLYYTTLVNVDGLTSDRFDVQKQAKDSENEKQFLNQLKS